MHHVSLNYILYLSEFYSQLSKTYITYIDISSFNVSCHLLGLAFVSLCFAIISILYIWVLIIKLYF